MLLGLGAEAERVDVVDDLAQVVAALNLVLNLAEDFADLVFDRGGAGRLLLEGVEIRKELRVHEVAQVVAGEGGIVVELTVFAFRCGPALPAIRLLEDEAVFLAVQLRFDRFILLKRIEIFQEEEPGRLLDVVEFGGAAGFFPEDVIDIAESLLEHGLRSVTNRGIAKNGGVLVRRRSLHVAAEFVGGEAELGFEAEIRRGAVLTIAGASRHSGAAVLSVEVRKRKVNRCSGGGRKPLAPSHELPRYSPPLDRVCAV